METGIMLFNGLHFPTAVADRAIAWSKTQQASLLAVFLKTGREKAKGYGFPSDLRSAETVTKAADATAEDIAIINNHMKLLKGMAASEHVSLQMEVLSDPTADEVKKILYPAGCIFTDEAIFEPGPIKLTGLNLKRILQEGPAHVAFIKP